MNTVFTNTRKEVLVAEDNDANYYFILSVLTRANMEVIRAVNGQEAIDICKNNPNIRLVFMDIRMPMVDGIEATREIKKHDPLITVIAQTAYVMQEDKSNAIAAGCDGIIAKPIKKADLLAFIDQYAHAV